MADISLPRHIGFIMDGNGRWAKKRGMPRSMGHRAGAEVFKKSINWCREIGIQAATFYAFSTENWSRPADEIKAIMNLLRSYIKDLRAAAKENVRIIILGDISRLDKDIADDLRDIMEKTKENDGFYVGIALNYGGRAEITRACKLLAQKCADGELSAGEITEQTIDSLMYTAEMPPVDLIIRPSGEQRLSNFLIWQAAYAEFVFLDVLWPDFSKTNLEYAVNEYSKRNRRFGGV